MNVSSCLFRSVTVAANMMPEFCPVSGLARLCFRTRPLLGVAWLPVNAGPLVLLLLASLLMRNASFIGHLAGIVCGYVIGWSRGSWVTLEPALLGRVGLLNRLDFVLTAADVTEGKPHPEIYETAALRHGVPTGQLLVFEDSANGCRAAVAAGAVVVAVPGGHSRRHDFSGAHLVADSLADERIYRLLGAR